MTILPNRLAVITALSMLALFSQPAPANSDHDTPDRPRATGTARPAMAMTQTLFKCRAGRVFKLRPLGDGSFGRAHGNEIRQADHGDIRLTLDLPSRTMRLIVPSVGGGNRSYALQDVEQGGSAGSGAGGRADTTIRAQSGRRMFMLHAEYTDNGDFEDAALQIGDSDPILLTCRNGRYSEDGAKGLGPYGFTNIYTLAGDGVVRPLTDIPELPDYSSWR